MRIALVVPGGVDESGEYRVIPALLALIRRLSARHDVHVFALWQQEEPATWTLAGARIQNIGRHHTRSRAILAIRRAHREARFDVVHAIWSATVGLIATTAARMLRIPSIVHVAGGELVAIPDIAYGGALGWRSRLRERMVLRMANVITVASEPSIQRLRELGFTGQRVPLGVDLEYWPPRQPVPRSANEPIRLIHVASLNKVKDQPMLLRALATLRQAGLHAQLDIIGEDTLGGEIQQLVRQYGLDASVRFHGFLTQARVRPLIEAAHLMLVSSRHETGPLVALEAAVVGVPTVGTAVGHIAEWAPDAAASVPVGNASALASAIESLLRDEGRRLRIGSAAHVRAIKEDADYTAACFEKIYASLSQRKR